MAAIQKSAELLNTAAVAANGIWFVPLDLTLLEDYPEHKRYFNYCLITNTSGQAVRVAIGNSSIRIANGDAYEWALEPPVHFDYLTITNLSAVQLAIGTLLVEYAKVV